MNIFKKAICIGILFNYCSNIISMEQNNKKEMSNFNCLKEQLWMQSMHQKIQNTKKKKCLEELYKIILKYISLDLVVENYDSHVSQRDYHNDEIKEQERTTLFNKLKEIFPFIKDSPRSKTIYEGREKIDQKFIYKKLENIPKIFTIAGVTTILSLLENNDFSEFVKNQYTIKSEKKDNNVNENDNELYQIKILKFFLEHKEYIQSNIYKLDHFKVAHHSSMATNRYKRAIFNKTVKLLHIKMLFDLINFMQLNKENFQSFLLSQLFKKYNQCIIPITKQYPLDNPKELYKVLYREKKTLKEHYPIIKQNEIKNPYTEIEDYMRNKYKKDLQTYNEAKIQCAQLKLIELSGTNNYCDDTPNITLLRKIIGFEEKH